MIDTEKEFWFSNPWHHIKIPRYGHNVTYIDKKLEKLEKTLAAYDLRSKRRENIACRWLRLKHFYIKPIWSWIKKIISTVEFGPIVYFHSWRSG